MIIAGLIWLVGTFLLSIVGLLPSSDPMPETIGPAITAMVGYANSFSYIFPWGTAMTIMGLILGIESTIMVFNLFVWAYNKFRGTTGGGI